MEFTLQEVVALIIVLIVVMIIVAAIFGLMDKEVVAFKGISTYFSNFFGLTGPQK